MNKPNPKFERDKRSNDLNPTHPNYHRDRGAPLDQAEHAARTHPAVVDNRSNVMNPNNKANKQSRD